MDTYRAPAGTAAARYLSLAAELGEAPPAVLDGLEVVEEQVLVLGPLDLSGPVRRRSSRREGP